MKLHIKKDKKYTKLSEAFGMNEKLFDKVCKDMTKFFALRLHDHDHIDHSKVKREEHEKYTSKTLQLEEYLASSEFKKIGWEIKNANDHFLLGALFVATTEKALELYQEFTEDTGHDKHEHHGIKVGSIPLPKELGELLKNLFEGKGDKKVIEIKIK